MKGTSRYTDVSVLAADRMRQFEEFLTRDPVPPLGYIRKKKPPEQRAIEKTEREVLG